MNYIIYGDTLSSYFIAHHLIKNNYNVNIIPVIDEEINIDNIYFSSGDTLFLDFLDELNINFKDISIKYDLELIKKILPYEIKILINLYFNLNLFKNLQLINFLIKNNFSTKSKEIINDFCSFFNKDLNIINVNDFIDLINYKLFSDHYKLNYNKLIHILREKFNLNNKYIIDSHNEQNLYKLYNINHFKLTNNIFIENIVISSYMILHDINIIFKKIFKIYNNDSFIDFIKIYFLLYFYINLFQKIKCIV